MNTGALASVIGSQPVTVTVPNDARLQPPTVTPPFSVPSFGPSGLPSKGNGPAIGLWVIGGIVVLSLADTKAAPLVTAFLAAAAFYNLTPVLTRITSGGNLGGSSGGSSPSPAPFTGAVPGSPVTDLSRSGAHAGGF